MLLPPECLQKTPFCPQPPLPPCLLQHTAVTAGGPRLQLLQLQRGQVEPQPLQLLHCLDGSQLLLGGGAVRQQA